MNVVIFTLHANEQPRYIIKQIHRYFMYLYNNNVEAYITTPKHEHKTGQGNKSFYSTKQKKKN